MSREQTWVLLTGVLLDNVSTASFATTSYQRQVLLVTLNADTAPQDDKGATFTLTNDGSLGAQVFTLTKGSTTSGAITVANSGLVVAASKVLTVTCTFAGGVQDVSFWIESVIPASAADDTWSLPTAADIQGSISAPEYAAFTAALIQGSQADPIPGILSDTVNEIRDAIRTGRRNNLGPVGTIPGGAMHTLGHICKWHLFDLVKSLPGFADKSIEARKGADEYLDKVRKGEVVFVEPTTYGETITGASYGFYDTPISSVL